MTHTVLDIRTRFQNAMNESDIKKSQTQWHKLSHDAYYASFPKENQGRWITPASKNPTEIIRAYFGTINPEGEIQKFLEINGVKSDYYSGTLDAASISGSFDSWGITLTRDVNWFGKKLSAGITYYIVNARKVSKDNVVAVIGDKDTTPTNMKLEDIRFKTIGHIMDAASNAIRTVVFNKDYIDFMQELVDAVGGYSISNKFTTALDMASSSTPYNITHDFSKYDGVIDSVSINNIKKDFGEVLGGILMFGLIKQTGEGLVFPKGSNEAVMDFEFDNLKISSKSDKGGNASASGYLELINNAFKENKAWIFGNEEKDFIDNCSNVILADGSEPKNTNYYKRGKGSGTFSNTVKLCNMHLGTDSAWYYWASATGISIHSLNRDAIIQSFVDLKKQGSVHSTLNTYINKAGGFRDNSSGSSAAAKMTAELVKAKNEDEIVTVLDKILKIDEGQMYDVLVGIILYPSSKNVVDILNQKYSTTLSDLINKALSAKQLYLKLNIKKGSIDFEMKSMSVSNFEITGLNGASSWMTKGLGIKMVK